MDTPQIPAEIFLDHVISALTSTDAATLRHLESIAPAVGMPGDRAQYLKKNAVLSALLDTTGRNLRLLRRVAGNQVPRWH